MLPHRNAASIGLNTSTSAVWCYFYKRFPICYAPLYWSVASRLRMRATSTFELAHAMKFGFLGLLSKLFFGIAPATWLVVFAGMLRGLINLAVGRAARQP